MPWKMISSLHGSIIFSSGTQRPSRTSSSKSSCLPLPQRTTGISLHHVFTHPSALLLEMCRDIKELDQMVSIILKNDLQTEYFIQTKLVSLYSKFGHLDLAERVFESIENKGEELYYSMLKGHAKFSSLERSLLFFTKMQYEEIQPNVYNFNYLLKACSDLSKLRRGREIHSQLISHGFASNVFAMTAVMNMYAKCQALDDAQKLFDRMSHRDLVSWNAIIAGYAQGGQATCALKLVYKMQEENQKPDSVTLVSTLPACADIRSLIIGKSIHGYVTRAGFELLINLSTALVDMYAKCGSIKTARLVFDRMTTRNVVSWNSMIDGYARNGNFEEAMSIFHRMLDSGIEPTDVSILAALQACANIGDLNQGKVLHELSIQVGLDSDVSVNNALITMYSKCKRVDMSLKVFEKLKNKTRVSWNAIVIGLVQNGLINEALSYFTRMQEQNIRPDSFTLVSIIPALSELSLLRRAKWAHGYAIRAYLDKDIFVITALIDMYAKCGGIHVARKLFDMMEDRHVTTWNSMIDGYGTHGLGNKAVELFEDMQKKQFIPNDVTFLCVLSACSHSGLVDKGWMIFKSMNGEYNIQPGMDHYGTMVDLLGRAGKLDEAWDFIEKMPIEPGISVYGAMLGACKIHRNVKLGEKTARKLFELEPKNGGYHALLSNIYATSSMWENVAKVRMTMEKTGLQKTPGWSIIELRSELHTFYSGSTNHPLSKKIYGTLDVLIDEIKAIGYVPDTASTIHDVEEDLKEQLLNSHSEKLAIAFALISTTPGTTIQILKNLRVCQDCHNAIKFISKVTGREIIIRDMHRFHHFKDGYCSCGDYW